MKIFLVCNSLGGGGAERVHVNLANGFAKRGHEVYLIADVNQPASYPVDEQVHVLPLCPQSSNKFVKWGKAVLWLRKYMKQYKPDVVIGNMHLCSLISRIASVGLHTPVVMTIHHALESKAYDGFSKIEKFLDRYTPSLYAATTVLTKADYIVMNEKYHHQKNIHVMPNPLTFLPLSIEGQYLKNEKGEIVAKENVILAAGRMNDWKYKGWDILIQAAGLIKQQLRSESWKIMIAGGGPESSRTFLAKLCEQEGVNDCIEFMGYRNDIKELMQRASIFCLSSRSEGLPMVLIEAMSQGCAPVACENLGRTREIITNDDEGLLFKTADIDDLAKRLSSMISTPSKRNQIQSAVIKRSEYYQIDNIVKMWETLFNTVCH